MALTPSRARRRATDGRKGRPVEPVASGPVGIADLLHAPSTNRTKTAALAFVAFFVVITAVAAAFGKVQGPVLEPFLPISASLWGAAELLTSYLLLTQFAVNGVRAFLVLGAAYAVTGLLTIPYLAYFPGLFLPAHISLGTEQVSALLWTAWNLTFPLLVGVYFVVDQRLTARIIDPSQIRGNVTLTVVLVLAGVLVIVGLVNFDRNALPQIVDHGRFTPLWHHVYSPAIIAVNALAALLVAVLARRPSRLHLWIAVALATSALDAVLNAFSSGRYTISWYVGKFETLTTASVVLAILLSEVGAMYRRLGTMAMLDSLTGLRNRRAFADYLRWVLRRRREGPSELSFLVLDVDFFKGFNDRYGHAAGDVALRRIANSIVDSLHRELDVAARFGGEEFVVLLPETGAVAAEHVAERIRRGVEQMGITHGASTVYSAVTVSIGVAYVDRSTMIDMTTLFGLADHALYRAKERRNCVVVVPYSPDDEKLRESIPRVLSAAE